MEFIENFDDVSPGAVVAVGNFDGVHRGHQSVILTAKKVADTLARPLYVLTFNPHPRKYFQPQLPLFQLTPPPLKAALVKTLGGGGMLTFTFDAAFAKMSAQDFIDKILLRDLRISHIVTGYNFHFGARRQGTPEFLRQEGRRQNFGTTIVERQGGQGAGQGAGQEVGQEAGGEGGALSSSRIREALAAGDLSLAGDLLGYSWTVRAGVQRGDQRGRTLGFPTANLQLSPDCPLKHGIYTARVLISGKIYPAVASFGRRPTFDDGKPLLEVHVFGYSGDLYGKQLPVALIGFLRSELRFESPQALQQQMERDAAAAHSLLRQGPGASTLEKELFHVISLQE